MQDGRELCFQPAAVLARLLRDRKVSAAELVEAFLARIKRHNGAAKAYIAVTADAARRTAAECDGRLRRRDATSLLCGIPFGTKDLIDIEGVPTTGGSAVLQDNVAARSATVIERVTAAGAISLGKTNLHEFAYGTTGENGRYGTAVNAYDSSRLACGSSSGSAAAVAHGLAAFALGTDTGGSVRVPAVMNGLVGLKPTFGRIPTEGVLPYCWSLDHVGLITRTVGDCAALFELCAEPDGDPPFLGGEDIDSSGLADRSLAGLRVGIPAAYYFERTDPEIGAAAEAAISHLERSGAAINEVALPEVSHARTVSLTIQMPEALSFHSRYLEARGHLYSADFRAGLALGQYILAEHYVRAKRLVEQYRAGMRDAFKGCDVILTPATPIPAPEIGTVSVTMEGVEEPVGNALTRFTSFFNMTGHPALTLPVALHALGLPIGVQLVGRYGEERLVLGVAAALERQFGPVPLPRLG
jgi:aspartyl-tRNA(Asn)/glutamyl-tRNA(Gln) amidotransferase subunit A